MENQKIKKPIILIFADYYLPGFKSGGGMRTIVNMVDRLKTEYDFRIVTQDHDGKLDKEQYTSVEINKWNDVRGAKVFYLSKDNVKISKLGELVLEVKPDSIYLNSFFSTLAIYLLALRKFKRIPKTNVILAPCGELSDGALKLKNKKKRLFFKIAKISSLYKNIIWKASNELEKNEIERLKPKEARYVLAADLSPKHIFKDYKQEEKPPKESGEVKMVFLSRFVRKKNFKWLVENLGEVKGKLTIDIFGPIEDKEYWDECLKIIKQLPNNISVKAKGSIPHEEILEKLFAYHFFIIPTLGENFGHIFLESLASGCPLIISDQTPWRNLQEKRIGWDLSLNDIDGWNRVINQCVSIKQREYSKLSENSRKFVLDWLSDKTTEADTVRVLEESLRK